MWSPHRTFHPKTSLSVGGLHIDSSCLIQTNMAAIGGETTGVVIKVGDLSWELDLGENRALQELAEKLNGKTVLIKGTLMKIKGTEIGERNVVVVESLSASD